jgi:benzoylformate decarboxylase
MVRMNGARAFLECLKLEGVRYIFGNPGTTEVPLLEALCGFPEITYILTLQEGVAIGMADGYTRGSGEIGVVNVHTAVGTANTIGGIYTSYLGKSPVLVAIANKDMRILGRNCFCEVPDLPGLTRQFTKWSWEVRRPERIPEDLLRGIKVATTIPQGPVFLSFAEDLLAEEIDVEPLVSIRPRSPLSFQGNEGEIREAAQLLLRAEAPLFIAGNEVAQTAALPEAVELAEMLGLPVMTEPIRSLAFLNFPHTHPHFRGEFHPHSPHVKKADLVLGIGCKLFVDFSYSKEPALPGTAKIVHFHSDPHEFVRLYPEEISVLCNAKEGLRALLAALRSLLTDSLKDKFRHRMEWLKKEKEEETLEKKKVVDSHRQEVPIHLSRLVHELNRSVGKEAIIVDESVISSGLLLKLYDFEVPGTYHHSPSGALGWGVPAALGMKLANPNRQVIAFVGDGSFTFSIQSLWTAAKYGIAVVIVVCNNQEYRAVKDACIRSRGPGAEQGPFIASDLRDPDIEFSRLAEGFGVWARKITDPEEIRPSLEEALSLGKPSVLDVRIS